MESTTNKIRVAIVGCGPRGLSVLERLCANARLGAEPLQIDIIDPFPPGAGSVWRTNQSRNLLMNTVCSQITVFTDPSVKIGGPIEPGPSLYEWTRQPEVVAQLSSVDRREARGLGPDDYPTRALYGTYLTACLDLIRRSAPDSVDITIIRDTAVDLRDLDDAGTEQRIELASGRVLDHVNAVVLTIGHGAVALDEAAVELDRIASVHGLSYLVPANPCEVDLSVIGPEQPVLIRGAGLNFFDYMALLTEGRGGRYDSGPDGLIYRRSGAEPEIYVGSRRGIPHHARGENQKGPHGRYTPRLLTEEFVTTLRSRKGKPSATFRADLWPLIAREVECVYYEGWLHRQGQDNPDFAERYLTGRAETLEAILDEFHVPTEQRWDWDRVQHPWRNERFEDSDGFQHWLRQHLVRDVALAREGNVDGPVKAALDVLRDLRNEIRLAVDHAGIDGRSYRDELEGWYTPLNAYLSIGPPARRVSELIALIDSGIVRFIGPNTRIGADAAGFHASSDQVPGSAVSATALIEARLPEVDLRRSRNPLLRRMFVKSRCRPYTIASDHGTVETGGLAVTESPYRLISTTWPDGHPNCYAFGIPTEAVHWVTAAGTRPGVNSVTLCDSDAIARDILYNIASSALTAEQENFA